MSRTHGMGRLYLEDERDKEYPVAIMLSQTELRKRYWWSDGWWGDQGMDPHCVAFSWAHWLADGPKPASLFQRRRPGVSTSELYCEAQKHDPWPGDCKTPLYDGTSVRAGAKVLKDWGHIEEYRWAANAQEVAQVVLTQGPVVMGTLWYEGMSSPSRTHALVTPTGKAQGGHAYLLNGVDLDSGYFRIKNSWGRNWGDRGHAFISIDNMDKLIKNFGEACVAIQKRGKV
jgi:hypothetical protein